MRFLTCMQRWVIYRLQKCRWEYFHLIKLDQINQHQGLFGRKRRDNRNIIYYLPIARAFSKIKSAYKFAKHFVSVQIHCPRTWVFRLYL